MIDSQSNLKNPVMDYFSPLPTSPLPHFPPQRARSGLPTPLTGYRQLKMLSTAKSCQDHKKDRYDRK